MGDIYDDFVRELAGWQRRYAGRPRAEMMALFFLALEREQIVAVGYRESLIERRLHAMPIEPAARELIRHAMLWAWKDEEMHAIYVRGAIFQLGDWSRRARALIQQLAGGVGGWASSVQHHVPWRRAPLSRALAELLTGAGTLAGRVPPEVRRQLQFGPFRNFCRFNVDAEKTAWLCWKHLADLAQGQPDLAATVGADFARIRDDEARHERLFETLAAALDEQDRLVPGETPDTVADKIGAISPFFLPRSRRGIDELAHPIGTGGAVHVMQGRTADAKRPSFRRLLDESGLAERLLARARALGKPVDQMRVAIKPTFMMGYHRKDLSCLTDPELVEELALYLHRHGIRDLAVVEARNLYDHFFQNRSVHGVAHYFRLTSPLYRIVDVSREQVAFSYTRGLAQYTVGRTWKEADFRISFGKMVSQPVDLVHLTVKNLEGLGSRCEEFFYVERRAHRQTALMMLMDDFPPHFALLDAYGSAADGMLGMMGCPQPKVPRRLYAGADALAVDCVAARQMGLKDVRASTMLRAACHWFGDPAGRIAVVGIDTPIADWRGPYSSDFRALLSMMAWPVWQFGSGRGMLFAPEMDEQAFPPVRRVGPMLRLTRRVLQAFLGLRHPAGARSRTEGAAPAMPTLAPRRSDSEIKGS